MRKSEPLCRRPVRCALPVGGTRVPRAPVVRVALVLAALLAPRVLPQEVPRIQDRPGFLEAYRDIAEGRERQGAAKILEIVAAYPGDPDIYLAYYNIACAHARLGETSEALSWLEKAYEAGYGCTPGRLQRILQDPDLESLRALPAFQELLHRMQERFEEIQRNWPTECKAYVRWPKGYGSKEPEPKQPGLNERVPDKPGPDEPGRDKPGPVEPAPENVGSERLPLLVVLHGYGDYKVDFAERTFGGIADELGALVMAPTGHILIAPKRFGWFRSEGEFMASSRTDQRDVWLEVRRVREEYPVDPERVFVIGVGQGATLAFTFGLRNPQQFAGVLAISGRYLKESLYGGWLHVSGGYKLPVCLLQGKWDKDEMVEQARNARDLLAEVGVNVRYEEYDGDAALPADHQQRLMAAVKWLMGQKKAGYKPPPDFDERFREVERRDDGRPRGTDEGGR
ncbi:MAG: PHB depolymerase family esterase [Planctomycetota bacterium]